MTQIFFRRHLMVLVLILIGVNSASALAQFRILYVDDNELNLDLMEAQLEKILGSHLTLELLKSPEDALDKIIEGQDYDLIITDYHMKSRAGEEFHGGHLRQKIRQLGKTMPIVLYSSREVDFLQVQKQVFDEVIRKPASAEFLRAFVQEQAGVGSSDCRSAGAVASVFFRDAS